MNGRLIYVMGPSGVGKDTLLAYARVQLAEAGLPVLFAHRYITRAADAGGENHIALTQAEFAERSTLGLFALEWQSHGLRYGIGREIDLWLARGATVVINGSRGYCQDALAVYPAMGVVLIEADNQVLARRLASRGRESEQQVRDRLAHRPAFELPEGAQFARIDSSGPAGRAGSAAQAQQFVRIDNSGSLNQGGDALVQALSAANG